MKYIGATTGTTLTTTFTAVIVLALSVFVYNYYYNSNYNLNSNNTPATDFLASLKTQSALLKLQFLEVVAPYLPVPTQQPQQETEPTTSTSASASSPSSASTKSSNINVKQPITQESIMIPRSIVKVFKAVEKAEGAGARVRRSIGVPQLRNFSPFLMLDHFTIGKEAGFPDHPHRGQETITYLLSGSVDHEDFTGSKGTIHAGDLQFMTAGRGIVHAEMPGLPDPSSTTPSPPNVGMQLWVDLPKHLKYCEPRYRDLRASEIPTIYPTPDGIAKHTPDAGDDGTTPKVVIKIISGESHGVESVKDLAYTPVWILDITIRPGGRVVQALPKGWNAFMYTLSGTVTLTTSPTASRAIPEFHNTVLSREGDGVELSVPEGEAAEARLVLVAGMVLEQDVVQYGPFVVSSQEEVYQAMRDYQLSQNGFERAKGWRSEIGQRM